LLYEREQELALGGKAASHGCYPSEPAAQNVPSGTRNERIVFPVAYGLSWKAEKHLTKLMERSGNLYENKGPVGKNLERSGNVYENKAT